MSKGEKDSMKRSLATLAVVSLILLAATSAFAADGAALFKSKCAMCHGADGKGETSMGKSLKLHDFSSADVQKQTDAELKKIIEDGKGKMPSYKAKLAAGEADALVAFIRTLKK
jgi:mono/diheme cytochrome c family protein